MATRLFFATDVHGSEACWRKFINAGKHYEAHILVLGGDMTGKAVVPIIDEGSGHYDAHMQGVRHRLEGVEELADYKRYVRDHGYYPVVMSAEERDAYAADSDKLDALFSEEKRRTIGNWVAWADEKLASSGQRCIVCPGNDDDHDIDSVLATSAFIAVGEGNALDLAEGYELVSSGWTNRTPWHTPREEDESKLKERIMTVVRQASASPDRLVLSLHAPPYDTQLDVAPKIDWETLKVKGQETAHVGSKAVREVIEEVQPVLSLHGHIHESRGAIRMGRTLAINPGSSYVEGTLSGVIVDLDGKSKLKRYQLTTG
jgi:Icc-related predicted phosphoesterase